MIPGIIILLVILIVLIAQLGAILSYPPPWPPNWGPDLEEIEKYGWEEAVKRYEEGTQS